MHIGRSALKKGRGLRAQPEWEQVAHQKFRPSLFPCQAILSVCFCPAEFKKMCNMLVIFRRTLNSARSADWRTRWCKKFRFSSAVCIVWGYYMQRAYTWNQNHHRVEYMRHTSFSSRLRAQRSKISAFGQWRVVIGPDSWINFEMLYRKLCWWISEKMVSDWKILLSKICS
jgi:hypothetical protein